MSEPIKIVVTAETAAAAAELQKIPEVLDKVAPALKKVKEEAAEGEGALFKNRMALMELGHVGRATAESLAFGMNPLKVLALESPRIVQALSMMGISLAALGPYALAAAAAAGAGYVTWQLYMAGVEDTTKANEELVKSLDKVPALLEKINSLKKAGLVSQAAGTEFADYLNGRKKLYVQPDGSIGPNATETINTEHTVMPDLEGGQSYTIGGMETRNLPVANQQQIQDYLAKNLPQVSEAQLAATVKLKELQEEIRINGLEGVDKLIAKEKEEYDKRREQLLLLAQQAGNLIGPKQLDAATVGTLAELDRQEAAGKITIEKKAQIEIDRQDAELQKTFDAMLQSERELEKSITEEEKKQNAEKLKQLQLQQEISRSQIQANLESVRSNPFLTEEEKRQQSVVLEKQLIQLNAQRIAQLQQIASDPATDANGQLEAQKQITDLMVQQGQLKNEVAGQEHPWRTQIEELKSESEITMTSLAATFAGVFNSAIASISSGITGLITGTLTWGQALYQISNTILTTIVQSIVQMGVRWVLTQIMMAIAGKAILASAVAATVPMAAAQSAIWAVPATLSTIASYGGAAAAAPGEIALASAATLGLSAFAEGGRPPVGAPSIVGEKGWEIFMPDSAGTIISHKDSMAMLSNANHIGTDRGASGQGGGGAGGSDVKIVNFFDPRLMLDHLQKSDEHEKYIVDVMANNIHRFR
jgi:hypothetical protein